MLVRLQVHAEPLEPFEDLDAEGADPGVQPVGAQLARGPYDAVQVAVPYAGEGVG
ncbi:hypothetical protein [Nonomuraea sp. NPDC052265]|uniref:hypothetical protein n=1 Tax=Nonomuraea sp. NPDC052265 TaxID=3364374 RepID=UPI0037CBF3C1